MSIIKKLGEEIKNWDKFEGAGSIYWVYGWNKKKETEDSKSSEKAESISDGTKKNISSRNLSKLDKNEDENDDYRDDTQGNRNAKYLKKARIRANTPQARLKRERTEFKKELNGQ